MKNLWIVVVLMLMLYACRKSDNLSEIPKITYTSFDAYKNTVGKDTAALLVFEYEDGDGDLGSLPTDSSGYRNLFVRFFEKKNGVFIEPVLPGSYNAQIPNLTPKAKNKSISGDISYSLLLPPAVTNDTIKLQVYIVDRANHKSNVIDTDELVITTQ